MFCELIERFRYRFSLWWREERDDVVGTFTTPLPDWHAYAPPQSSSKWDDPKYKAILNESTPRFVVRTVGVYFGIIIITAQICRLLAALIPAARFLLAVTLVAFIGLWTLMSIATTIDFYKRRKAQRGRHSKII